MKPRFTIQILITLVCFSTLTAGCSIPNSNTIQAGTPIKVLILLGQSNMVGCARADEFPPGMAAPSDRRLILTDNGWIPLMPGAQNGPEISLAYELAQAWPEETIGIIKVAVGGTGIRAFIPDWSQDLADITGDGHKGSLYAQIKARIDQASSISEVEFVGVVWKQGGKDSWSLETAEGYLEYLRSIIEALRQDTNTPTLPLFISTYFDAQDLLLEFDVFAEAARGRVALFDVLMAHNLAQDEIPCTQTVATGWLPVTADGIHFNTEGQILQGQMLADAIWFYYEFEGY
jgi:hypothetical protein